MPSPVKLDSVLGDTPPGALGFFSKTGTLTSTQILSMQTTPIEMVAAPGSGLVNRFIRAHFWLDYESAAYAAVATTDDLEIRYTDGSGAEVASLELTGFVDQTNDEHRFVEAATAAVATPAGVEPVANAALVAYLSGAITTGNSPVKYEIEYKVERYTW